MKYNRDWQLPESAPISRRKFLNMLGGMALGTVAMGVGGWAYATRIEPTWVDFVEVKLWLPRLDPAFHGFKLAQVSDIHLSRVVTAEKLAEVRDTLLQSAPDLVALTGDYLHLRRGYSQLIEDFVRTIGPLARAVPVVGVLGNHDYRVSARRMREMLAAAGVRDLNNDVMTIERAGKMLHIAGVDDPWLGRPRLSEVVAKMPNAGAAVLLAHEPDFADKSAATGRFDLQLSGHSHGGQVVLPLLGPPLLPKMGEKYPSGLYRVGQMLQYTNRGLGMVEPFVRFNCRPEVTIFTFSTDEDEALSS